MGWTKFSHRWSAQRLSRRRRNSDHNRLGCNDHRPIAPKLGSASKPSQSGPTRSSCLIPTYTPSADYLNGIYHHINNHNANRHRPNVLQYLRKLILQRRYLQRPFLECSECHHSYLDNHPRCSCLIALLFQTPSTPAA